MKSEGRFIFECDTRFGDGSGGRRVMRGYDYEDIVLDYLQQLQEPNKEYDTTGSWINSYKITDTKNNKEYTNIIKFIEAGFSEKDPKSSNILDNGVISLANREIYTRACEKAEKIATVYMTEYLNKNAKPIDDEDRFKYQCWKCGKPLNDANRSPLIYLSYPPKYACRDCDKDLL